MVPSSHGFTEQFIGNTIGWLFAPPLTEESVACPQEASAANFVVFPIVLFINVGEYVVPEGSHVISGDPEMAFPI